MNENTKDNIKKKYDKVEVKEKPESEIEITGEVPVEVVDEYRKKAIKKIQQDLELPGFRKGHVPEDMLLQHVGEKDLMKETADLALGDVYVEIVRDHTLDVVGRPNVTITKLATGNPIGFTITAAVYPKVSLPDYKKIAEKERKKHAKEDVEVSEKELEEELTRLQKMVAGEPKKDEGGKVHEPELPKLDDEFAKKLGAFDSLNDLKEKMRAQMRMEKERKAQEKKRLAIVDAIINETKIDVPRVFIEGELDQMVASFEEQVKRAGMELEGYLQQVGKTIEDLRKEWTSDAEKRAKMQIIFNEIAGKEHITPDLAVLEREVAHIREHYPDANEQSVRVYVASQMTNQKVFELLEEGKVKKEELKEATRQEDTDTTQDSEETKGKNK